MKKTRLIMESAHSFILPADHMCQDCHLAGLKSKWLSSHQGPEGCRFFQVFFILVVWSRTDLDPQPQGSAINYLTEEEILQCSRAWGPDLRITGLNPAYVIGKDIVISRDHLFNLSRPATSTHSLSCSASAAAARWAWRFSGSFTLDMVTNSTVPNVQI